MNSTNPTDSLALSPHHHVQSLPIMARFQYWLTLAWFKFYWKLSQRAHLKISFVWLLLQNAYALTAQNWVDFNHLPGAAVKGLLFLTFSHWFPAGGAFSFQPSGPVSEESLWPDMRKQAATLSLAMLSRSSWGYITKSVDFQICGDKEGIILKQLRAYYQLNSSAIFLVSLAVEHYSTALQPF